MKNVIIALLSLTTLGVITGSAVANETEVSGDKVIIQNSYQGSFQNGTSNQNLQQGTQVHREVNGKKTRQAGSYGSVQTIDQYQEQMGEMNSSQQTIIQRTEMRNRRGHRR